MIKEPRKNKKNSIFWALIFFLSQASVLFSQDSALSQSGNLVVNPSFEEKIDFQNTDSGSNWSK
ncbi:MAG: hypothetical protein R6W31_07295, partial [Bacteroidales bacterium]